MIVKLNSHVLEYLLFLIKAQITSIIVNDNNLSFPKLITNSLSSRLAYPSLGNTGMVINSPSRREEQSLIVFVGYYWIRHTFIGFRCPIIISGHSGDVIKTRIVLVVYMIES